MDKLIKIMEKLRDPKDGCPWDKEQTFESIAPYTIEEAYEVDEAIKLNDMGELRDELGDLLFQVVFHSRIAEEAGHFAFDDVVSSVSDKMVRRHPHIFAGAPMVDPVAHKKLWEDMKAKERAEKAKTKKSERESVLDGVTISLPALTRAVKLQKRAARVGFDWPNTKQVLDKIREETDELYEAMQDQKKQGNSSPTPKMTEEFGDLLFVMANLARHMNIKPEEALKATNRKFERRFHYIEDSLASNGKDIQGASLEEMDALWNEAKKEGK